MPSQTRPLKWMLPALTLALLGHSALAETFDVATFNVPKGYQKNTSTQNVVRYVKQSSITYCILDIYRSAQGSGNVKTDFQQEWAAIVAKPLGAEDPELEQGTAKNGWQNLVGGGLYQHDGGQGLAVLSTYSSPGARFSVLLLTNEKSCVNDLDTFLTGLTLKKPASTTTPTTSTPVNTLAVTGYKYTTTNFDNGWVATQQKDWVEVRKGNVTVRLHYAIAYTDQTRNLSDQGPVHFWNQVVQTRYPAQKLNVKNIGGGYTSGNYLGESDVTESTSGRRVHVALLVVSNSGYAYCYEIVTPDQATFNQMFPTYESLASMSNYNRFNVDKTDLGGTWENSSSAYGMYYSTVTGDFMGMRGASIYDKFIFNSSGQYQYEYIGASGFIGTQTVAQGKRSGKYTVSSWSLTTTDTAGKTDQYTMYFEGIRGGRVLHLQNKQASGLKYALVKTQ